jgi:flagellar biosynthetic protein FlhB
MTSSHGERTEKPTAKKRKDARERGQIARSRDLAAALSFAAVTLALGWCGGGMLAVLSRRIAAGLTALGDHARASIEATTLTSLIWSDAGLASLAIGPVALVAGTASMVASAAQTGLTLSPKALNLNWARLSPGAGVKRLGPSQAGLDLVKALIGVIAVGAVSYAFLRPVVDQATGLTAMSPVDAARAGWHLVFGLLWRAGLVLIIVAGADYGLQRWRWYSQLKMSRQEVRDDSRLQDGSPELKARVRRVQREMNKRRMLHAVKTATVVVTNPTHFAVALRYSRQQMAAPVVVAKGQDLLAARIRAIAREHEVPIVENVTLARALFRHTDVGDAIPADLFGAVAEVLAYLVRLKQLVL